MSYFVFRNSTVESLFAGLDVIFSGYGDITAIDKNAEGYIWFYLPPFGVDPDRQNEEIASYCEAIRLVLQQIPGHKIFILFTLQNIFDLKYQSGDFTLNKSISDFNTSIVSLSNEYSNVKVLDFSGFTRRYTLDTLIDWKYYFISKMQINPRLSKDFKGWFTKEIDAVQLRRKKCIVLDLDNTIWGGILGEDGIANIKIGGDYPGSAFLMFQKFLLKLSESGIILTVCSKNNEQDVLDAWAQNPFIVLKKDHIAACRIGWNNKAQSIKELAEELNIGLDSMVFIDDNPAERELVRQVLPEVVVPDFPAQPYLLPPFMEELLNNYFRIYSLTKEDLQKTVQYKANAERAQEQTKFIDFEEYLKSLDMVLTIEPANDFTIARIAQMTQKTNQFNLTTKRYDDADIRRFMEVGDEIYSLNVEDKFGDSGITGVIILKKTAPQTCEIDTFLLSCRILGKQIEEVFLFFVLNKIKKAGIKYVNARYVPTSKNMQVKDFYKKNGFQTVSGDEQDGISYRIDISSRNFAVKQYFKIIEPCKKKL